MLWAFCTGVKIVLTANTIIAGNILQEASATAASANKSLLTKPAKVGTPTIDKDRLRVISCAQSLLTRYSGDRITSVDMNFGSFGKTAMGLADMVKKQPHIWQLTATVKWSVEDVALQLPAIRKEIPEQRQDSFYRDTELQQMMKVENLLTACDETDEILLSMLLEGQSYGAMAEVCFLTEGAVKYRVKNMRTLCDCPDRESLENLLRLYIDN